MRVFLPILVLAFPNILLSQSVFEGKWTNGSVSYNSEKISDQQIQFWGSTLHEGGYGFYGEFITESKLKVLGAYPDSNREPSFGSINEIIEYKRLANSELMILINSSGETTNILKRLNEGESLKEVAFKNKVNHQLAGKYRDKETGKIITFLPNKFQVIGLLENDQYEIETDYDYPINVITINNKSFFYESSISGLKLYEKKSNQYNDSRNTETLLYDLALIEKIPIVNSELAGDYTFTSLIPLIQDILDQYNVEELRLIRNEIFARYGHQFKSQDLKKLFESKPWYEPTSEDVSTKLTELERMNVQLIQQMEKRKLTISDE